MLVSFFMLGREAPSRFEDVQSGGSDEGRSSIHDGQSIKDEREVQGVEGPIRSCSATDRHPHHGGRL